MIRCRTCSPFVTILIFLGIGSLWMDFPNSFLILVRTNKILRTITVAKLNMVIKFSFCIYGNYYLKIKLLLPNLWQC